MGDGAHSTVRRRPMGRRCRASKWPSGSRAVALAASSPAAAVCPAAILHHPRARACALPWSLLATTASRGSTPKTFLARPPRPQRPLRLLLRRRFRLDLSFPTPAAIGAQHLALQRPPASLSTSIPIAPSRPRPRARPRSVPLHPPVATTTPRFAPLVDTLPTEREAPPIAETSASWSLPHEWRRWSMAPAMSYTLTAAPTTNTCAGRRCPRPPSPAPRPPMCPRATSQTPSSRPRPTSTRTSRASSPPSTKVLLPPAAQPGRTDPSPQSMCALPAHRVLPRSPTSSSPPETTCPPLS